MQSTKPKDSGPECLKNQSIIDNLEEIRSGIIRIILAQPEKLPKDICGVTNTYIYDWVWGLGVPSLLTDGHCDYVEKDKEYLVSILVDSTELLCLDEPNWDQKRVNYSYRIGESQLREYKINQVL